MEEFYKTACDPFETLKNYIIDNGKYSSSSNEYTLYMGTSYSSDYSSKYTRVAYYDLDNQEIQLGLWIDSDTLAYFKVDSFDGTYEWVYFDDSDNYMTGTMYASTFGSNTILSYSSQNISGSSLRTAVQKLASSMLRLSVAYLDEDLSAIGITHDDLLFYSM